MEDNKEKRDQLTVAGKEENFKIENSKISTEKNIPDLDKLRLSQNFSDLAGVKKALVTVPVRKPNRQEFVRVHPNENMSLQTAVLQLKEERETYLVDPSLWSEVPGELIPMVFFTTINRQSVLTLWPIRLPGEDGRHNQWHLSALEAKTEAKKHWIRLSANFSLGGYDVFIATGDFPEPVWPEFPLQKIIEIAFKDRFIQDLDHPVLRRLRGEL